MIFDPCGELLKDYSAFCESLRVTEREDVYSSIRTRVVEVPPLPADVLDALGTAANPPGDGGDKRLMSSTGNAKGSRTSGRTGSKEKEKSVSGGRRKSLRQAPLEFTPKFPGEEAPPQISEIHTITYVSLHYPNFCLNQRDMMPLSRAMIHCPSLLSVELMGCGLSTQSYMQLVDAVYRSPRVLSVAVDFNQRVGDASSFKHLPADKSKLIRLPASPQEQVGFVADPTLRNSKGFSLGGALELSAAGSCNHSSASGGSQEQPSSPGPNSAPAPSGASAVDKVASGGRNATRAGGDDAKVAVTSSPRLSQCTESDVPMSTSVGLPRSGEVGDEDRGEGDPVLYFYPTQYCGLDQLPTQLELQLQEEAERKGRVDGKRLQQVQAQRETLRVFNEQNRMAIPRTWDSILFTGIRVLSLRGNSIDDATVIRIVDVLLNNPRSQLESLNLWGNNITDAGATSLAQLLRRSRDIRALDVGHNDLSDVGVLELIDTLRMQQVTSLDEVLAARRAYLTRRGASDEERKAAGQPLLATDIPSYEDLYAYWWYTQQQQQQQQQLHQRRQSNTVAVENSATTDGAAKVLRRSSNAAASLQPPPPPPPPPPQRDALISPSACSNSKRVFPAKNKTKGESAFGSSIGGSASFAAPVLSSSAARAAARPTAAFDKDCVRVYHLAENDLSIRMPGNITLEVLNLAENRYVTIAGAREAARRLSLREPANAEEMLAMVEVREVQSMLSAFVSPSRSSGGTAADAPSKRTSTATHRGTPSVSTSAPTVSTSIHPPELHCAGLRLRVCAIGCHRESDRSTWSEMDEVQRCLDASLSYWTSSGTPSPT
ncbi:hypothetical protein JKF63_02686 [Porcisia hertigi]|uniref:Uncharacterized protein n=1 Tax=Porcisia hertigi TaxID=2761500 RepID=A0A836L304_9TRYP|nr:hypothetical protein JKF63_02686 [Porcisia hertigi]